ncbi:hypothetical protein BH100B_04792 [Escherichia coli]|nr:hypothetical protein BH100B_04792 [Escherichia coli]
MSNIWGAVHYAASGMNKAHFVCNLIPGHHAQFILYCQP